MICSKVHWALSTGLEYDPGIYSATSELIALAKVAAKHSGRYISHLRSEDRYLFEAVDELLQVGREAEVPVQISHIKLAALDIWGQANKLFDQLNAARAEGIEVTADIYPYTYWHSTLTVLLPNRDFHDLEAARFALEKLAPADGLTLADYAPDPTLVGMTVADVATDWEMSDEAAYLKLIRDAYDGFANDENVVLGKEIRESVIGASMSESDIETLIAWQHTNICSDGMEDGHPRGHGAFPRALRMYVREKGIVTLEEMIRKMTSLAAANVGIANKGQIRPGFSADLVLFDVDTVTDNATIEDSQRVSEGIVAVWVNGVPVWREQKTTGNFPGQFVGRANN